MPKPAVAGTEGGQMGGNTGLEALAVAAEGGIPTTHNPDSHSRENDDFEVNRLTAKVSQAK